MTARATLGSLHTQPRFRSLDSVQADGSGEAWELSLSLYSPDTWSLEATRHGPCEPWCHQWVCLNQLFESRQSSVHTTFIHLTDSHRAPGVRPAQL